MIRKLCRATCGAAIVLLVTACNEPIPPAPTPETQPAGAVERVPAGFVSIAPAADPAAETVVRISDSTDTLTGVNLRMADLISVAFRTPERNEGKIPLMSAVRIEAAEPLPAAHYDVRVHVPGGDGQQLRALLRRKFEDTFGLRVRKQVRDADVLVLYAPDGTMRMAAVGDPPAQEKNTTRAQLTGSNLSLLAEQIEEVLQRPVVNETQLRSAFTLRLDWLTTSAASQPLPLEAARAALREQLRLDLKPARRSVEFLVVERAGTPK